MSAYVTYDDTNMRSVKAGNMRAGLKTIPTAPFFDLPYEEAEAENTLKMAKTVRSRFKQMIVIGIGGSDLGTRAIWQAVGDLEKGVWLDFLSNPDPEDVIRFVGARYKNQWKHTAINVISKSGNTLETLALFSILQRELIGAVGIKKHAEHVFVTTEMTDESPLFRLATEHGYRALEHADVGGRFSVLSNVGLFPAAVAGVDIKKLLAGARAVQNEHRRQGRRHAAARYAALHVAAAREHEQMIDVLMPYAGHLASFAQWYRQLWSESLNKRQGKGFAGLTPLVGVGTIDQHSQIQMFNEGPNDKVVTFLKVERFRTRVVVPALALSSDGSLFLPRKAKNLETVMHAALLGTCGALTKNGRPNGTLTIPKISCETLGALFQFFELATIYAAQLLGVNPYDQPGVEEGKRIARKLLS